MSDSDSPLGGLDVSADGADFARELSLFDIIVIGIGAMIGGSIFVLTGLAAGESGPALVLAFALNGFITIFTGMVYAELGSAFPEPGGGYLWVREALGRSQAFISGWMSWFAHAVAGSLYILSFGSFVTLILTEFFQAPTFGFSLVDLQKLFAVAAAAVFTYINYRGAKETSRAENVVTMLQLFILAVFIVAGLWTIAGQSNTTVRFEPFLPNGVGGVFLAMGLTFIAFEGYEIIVQSGREVVNPRENIPKAVFYSMFVVVTIYILVGIILLGAVDVTPALLETARQTDSIGGSTVADLPANPALWQVLGHLGEFGLAQAAGQLLPYGTLVILLTGILSALAALNATTFSSSRVGYALGNDRVFPDPFSRIHPDHQTPHISVLLSGTLIAVMAVSLPLAQVAAATDLMFLLLFLQVNYSMIRLRREYGDRLEYGYISPFFPYIPIVGILTKLFLAVYFFNYSPLAWYIAIAWILVGFGVFLVYSRGRIRRTEIRRETRVVSEERRPTERPYQVLVPIVNPESAKPLVELASAIARRNDGEVLLTSVVTIPVQTPLEDGLQFVEDEPQMLEDAMQYAPDDVPIHRTVTLGRGVGRSITNIAYQRDSELILLGWRGRRRRSSEFALGSTIDTVVENPPCDVAVAKLAPATEPREILVPITRSSHAAFAADVATSFARYWNANVTLLHVAEPGSNDFEPVMADRREVIAEEDVTVSTASVTGDDITDSILSYAAEEGVDTIVVGAAREGILSRVLFGDISERVGEQFDGRVVMVKKHSPIRSLLRQWVQKWLGRRRSED
ncbi:amino acid permease [Haladaptatus pallidirubidus]|uniref:Amino acid transporter n=1 Tax=Haladaptatus pallidirubidus TaxID=1008152 RepID=A0AAV3UJX3_9EURY|nr:amino acid permease [Haladaptatus pallidirubidus]